jgi:hypothetical protein
MAGSPCELLRRSATVDSAGRLVRCLSPRSLACRSGERAAVRLQQPERAFLTWAKADPIYRHLYSSVPAAQAGPTLRPRFLNRRPGSSTRAGEAQGDAEHSLVTVEQVHLYTLGAAAWGGRARRCPGRANHQDPVTPPNLPGGKPDSGPPLGRISEADGHGRDRLGAARRNRTERRGSASAEHRAPREPSKQSWGNQPCPSAATSASSGGCSGS